MSCYVEIRADARIIEKKGSNARGPFHFLEQQALLHRPNGESKIFRVTADPGKPYAPGEYLLDPAGQDIVKDAKGFDTVGYRFLALLPRTAKA